MPYVREGIYSINKTHSLQQGVTQLVKISSQNNNRGKIIIIAYNIINGTTQVVKQIINSVTNFRLCRRVV